MKPTDLGRNWDERYTGEEYFYGTVANNYLREQAFRLKAGMKALAIADGEGRNGVWLAEQGLAVVSVDASSVGIAKAEKLARSRGISLTTIQADLVSWNWPSETFDLVVAIFAHFPPKVRKEIHQRVVETLRPEGLVILEAYHLKHLGRSGGPSNPDWLYDADTLRRDFEDLAMLELFEGMVVLEEGERHQGESLTVRMTARK